MFTGDKIGEPMKGPMPAKAAKQWFGVVPPDLSVIARSRGADWLYTYLRTFYRDPKTATGWNNAVFPNVAMPHALWTLQGERGVRRGEEGSSARSRKGAHEQHRVRRHGARPGQLPGLDRRARRGAAQERSASSCCSSSASCSSSR